MPLVTTTPYREAYTLYRLRLFISGISGIGNHGGWISTDQIFRSDQWNHLVVTFDGTDFANNNPIFYLNGSSVSVTETDIPWSVIFDDNVSGIDFHIGRPDNSSLDTDARMAEVSIYDSILNASTVSNHYNASPATYPATVLGDNPIVYWRLQETSGSTTVDETGGSPPINGTYTGANITLDVSGPIGKAVDFGSNSYSTMGNQSTVRNIWSGLSTVELWVKPAKTGSSIINLLSKFDIGVAPLNPGWLLFLRDPVTVNP